MYKYNQILNKKGNYDYNTYNTYDTNFNNNYIKRNIDTIPEKEYDNTDDEYYNEKENRCRYYYL